MHMHVQPIFSTADKSQGLLGIIGRYFVLNSLIDFILSTIKFHKIL